MRNVLMGLAALLALTAVASADEPATDVGVPTGYESVEKSVPTDATSTGGYLDNSDVVADQARNADPTGALAGMPDWAVVGLKAAEGGDSSGE